MGCQKALLLAQPLHVLKYLSFVAGSTSYGLTVEPVGAMTGLAAPALLPVAERVDVDLAPALDFAFDLAAAFGS